MDVDAPLAFDRRRHFFDHTESERVEDRHELRKIDLPAGLVELDARQPLALRFVPETDEEALGGGFEPFEHQDVVDDQVPVVVGLVVVGESRRVLVHQHDRSPGTDAPGEGLEQVVLPGAGEPLDLLLELLVANVGDRHAGRDVDREEDPSRLRLAEREVVVDRRPVEAFEEQRLESLAEIGVEPVARESHHDRDVPSVEVAADQDPDATVLLELQQPDDEAADLLGRGLEELVLGERLEEGDDGLVVVRTGDQILGRDQLLELVMEQRRLGRRLHVGLAREQADQSSLADDRPVGIDLADADVVHPRTTVDRRVRLGLRVDQQLPVLDPIADVGRERREQRELRERRGADVREDPQTAAGNRLDRTSLLRLQQLVFAVAEEDEVQLEQPVEELRDLFDDLGWVADLGGARQLHHVPHPVLHRVEVPDHERDVPEDAAHARLEIGVHLVGQRPVDLEVHEGLAMLGLSPGHHARETTLLVADRADHRVEQAFDGETPGGELLRDGVDEERRVVGGDLDHRSEAGVAVDLRIGVEDADGGGVEASAVREVEGRGRQRVELVGGDLFEVLIGQPPEEGSGEDLAGFGAVRRLPGDPGQHLLDLGMEFGGGGRSLFDRVRHWRSRPSGADHSIVSGQPPEPAEPYAGSGWPGMARPSYDLRHEYPHRAEAEPIFGGVRSAGHLGRHIGTTDTHRRRRRPHGATRATSLRARG